MKFFGWGLKQKITKFLFPHMYVRNKIKCAAINEKLSDNGLFIVGHARSGTTVLQMALNLCPDIFLLNEASLHMHAQKKGFAEWYDGMQRRYKKPRNKDTVCPLPDDTRGDGFDVLLKARRNHTYVGDKLAFRDLNVSHVFDTDKCYEFFTRFFWGSHFVCVTRNPHDVIGSSKQMFSPQAMKDYAISYLKTLGLCIDICMTFERSFMFFHEDISPAHFETLGKSLGCDLSKAYGVYDSNTQKKGRYKDLGNSIDPALLEKLNYFYDRAREIFENSYKCRIPRLTNELSTEIMHMIEELKKSEAA